MLKDHRSLTDRVAGILMQRIQDGTYPVGTKLPAGRVLAQEFDVSAAVIREATERLRTQGYIKSRQGSGCVVLTDAAQTGFLLDVPAQIDKEALRHIYELRLDIEGGAAALAAVHSTDADIEQMERILASLEKTLLRPSEALEWDLKFHEQLALATHNPHYPRLLKYLAEQWRHSVKVARQNTLAEDEKQEKRALALTGAADSGQGVSLSKQVHGEHIAVLEAIKKGDPIAARLSAQTHLRNACKRLNLDIFTLTE